MTMSSLPGPLWLFLSPSLPDFHPVTLCEVPKIVITLSRKCTVFCASASEYGRSTCI